MCSRQRSGNEDEPLDTEFWRAKQQEVAQHGQRLLAIACKQVPEHKRDLGLGDVEQDMTMLGLIGIIDPPREEAIRAIAECRSAGIKVQMITGDYAPTARAIAGELGVDTGQEPLTGKEIETMNDGEFQRRAPHVEVFARSNPSHKIRLVKALQASRQIVR